MKSIAIIYGSSSDNTKDAASLIADKLADYSPVLRDVAYAKPEDFLEAEFLFLGSSTWNIGDLQDDWDSFLSKVKNLDMKGKTVALFGMGDALGYSDSFVDAIGILYEEFSKTGAKFVGEISTDGYSFDESRAVKDGKFVGLPLDADNESNQTESRIDAWLEIIRPYID